MQKPNITKKLGLFTLPLALAIITVLLVATPVMADAPVLQIITLLSGGTTQTAGYTYINPVAQPLNPANYSGGGAWTTASVITDQPSVWVQIGDGSQWVSTTADYSGVDDDSTVDSWRLFQDQFIIPAGANITSASIMIAADNAFELYFNNNLIATTAGWSPPATVYGPSPEPGGTMIPFEYTVTYTFSPQIGTNTLMFVVHNWDNLGNPNPTGLLYSVSITYETSSSGPIAVGGKVYKVDKFQLMLPWFGAGLGVLLTLFGFIFRKRIHLTNR